MGYNWEQQLCVSGSKSCEYKSNVLQRESCLRRPCHDVGRGRHKELIYCTCVNIADIGVQCHWRPMEVVCVSMTGVETGSRSNLKCRTAVRIHKKLPCKCSECKLLEFTRDINVGLPVSRQFHILHSTSTSVVMIPSLSRRRHYRYSQLPWTK